MINYEVIGSSCLFMIVKDDKNIVKGIYHENA